jgi:hypothetical protein
MSAVGGGSRPRAGGGGGDRDARLMLLVPRDDARASGRRGGPARWRRAPLSLETLDDLQDFGLVVAPAVAAAAARSSVDLGGMAALCADLARIQDTRALPNLLERAAAILHASGIVLWIADPDGRELTPIVVHGYSTQLAARFGTIPRDAGNVTAAAYRTGLLQTMKGDAISNGAVAVPLVTAGGCVGVMAAELKTAANSRTPCWPPPRSSRRSSRRSSVRPRSGRKTEAVG